MVNQSEQASGSDIISITVSEESEAGPDPAKNIEGSLAPKVVTALTPEQGEAKDKQEGSKAETPQFARMTRMQSKRSPAATISNFTTLQDLKIPDDAAGREPSAFEDLGSHD